MTHSKAQMTKKGQNSNDKSFDIYHFDLAFGLTY